MIPRVYISGAISSLSYLEALDNFEKIEYKLKAIGITNIFNPMKEIDPTLNYDTQMELCRTNLPNYDIIVLMDNWKKSPGAKQEFVWASQLGLKIMRDSESDYRSLEWKLTTQRELNIHPIKTEKA